MTKHGLRIVWLPVNQAWAVFWHDHLLRIFNDKLDATDYVDELLSDTEGAYTE